MKTFDELIKKANARLAEMKEENLKVNQKYLNNNEKIEELAKYIETIEESQKVLKKLIDKQSKKYGDSLQPIISSVGLEIRYDYEIHETPKGYPFHTDYMKLYDKYNNFLMKIYVNHGRKDPIKKADIISCIINDINLANMKELSTLDLTKYAAENEVAHLEKINQKLKEICNDVGEKTVMETIETLKQENRPASEINKLKTALKLYKERSILEEKIKKIKTQFKEELTKTFDILLEEKGKLDDLKKQLHDNDNLLYDTKKQHENSVKQKDVLAKNKSESDKNLASATKATQKEVIQEFLQHKTSAELDTLKKECLIQRMHTQTKEEHEFASLFLDEIDNILLQNVERV